MYKILIELRPEWAVKKVAADGVELNEKDKKELKPIEMLKLVMTRNKDDDKELFDMITSTVSSLICSHSTEFRKCYSQTKDFGISQLMQKCCMVYCLIA